MLHYHLHIYFDFSLKVCQCGETFTHRNTVEMQLQTDLDPVVDEATAVTSWPQMGVLLSAGHLDAPHRLPGLVELAVNWINPRVVRSHCIAHICRDAVLLERGRCGGRI